MARKAASAKHPALKVALDAAHEKALEEQRQFSEGLPGWNRFTIDERKFLLILPYFNTQIAAAEHLGFSQTWIDNHRTKDSLFGQAIRAAVEYRVNVARQYGLDLVPKAFLVLDWMITPDRNGKYPVDTRTLLGAVQTVLRTQGLDQPEQRQQAGGNYIQANTIKMFNFHGVKQDEAQQMVEAHATINE